ncbi:MAG TPA: hypothetical protein VMT35_19055 [Ignavibacteriaceae bacterium]|jgi:hypothetical protein|nr:hypothetical protein [Ignavibacteriaceae bacterium]
MKRFGRYKSKISISQYSGKLYIDPVYGIEQPLMKINYAIFSSRWDIEELPEDNVLKIIHRDSGDSISIAFNSLKDRINFVKLIYASKPVKQIGKGMNLENYANLHLKPKKERLIDRIFTAAKGN